MVGGVLTLLEKAIVNADLPLEEPTPVLPDPGRLSRWLRICWGSISWCFGFACLLLGLAILAAIPIVQILSLGYLLEMMGRVARSGRIRDAFTAVPTAGKIGVASATAWLFIAPSRFLAGLAADSELIDFNSPTTKTLHKWAAVLFIVAFIQVSLSIGRGGKLRYFFQPIKNLRWIFSRIREGAILSRVGLTVSAFVRQFEIIRLFSLGLRGFLGTGMWLIVPSALLVLGRTRPFLGYVGGLLLAIIVLYLPFLQAQFAAENRFRAIFEYRRIRELFRRSPIAFLITLLFTLILALPLYVFKIEVVERDILWLLALIFIVTILPAKLLAGWTYHRANTKPRRAHWIVRWGCRLMLPATSIAYVIFVFFSQYTTWNGAFGMFEHHAFLLPVPF